MIGIKAALKKPVQIRKLVDISCSVIELCIFSVFGDVIEFGTKRGTNLKNVLKI